MRDRNRAVTLADLEMLLGHPYQPLEGYKWADTDLRLVIENNRSTAHGVIVGVAVGNGCPQILGRIQEVSIQLNSHTADAGCYYIRTCSRECADILSLFHPLTRVVYDPVDYTKESFSDWGPLLVPGTDKAWEVSSDYEVLGTRGTLSLVLLLKNLKTDGVIEIPVTAKLEELIPHVI